MATASFRERISTLRGGNTLRGTAAAALTLSTTDAAHGTDSIGGSLTDIAGGTDALVRLAAVARALTDTASGSDSIGRVLQLVRAISDAARGTDSIGTDTGSKHTRAITDAVGGTDAVIHVEVFHRSVTDAAGGTDSVAWTYTRLITDAANGYDIVSLTVKLVRGRPTAAWSAAVQATGWRLVITASIWSSPSPGPQVQLSKTPLDITGGSITIDRSNSIRRSGSVTIADPIGEGWLPTSLSSMVAPNGNELHLTATAQVPAPGGGFVTTDTISLGWFAITDVEIDDVGSDLMMTITFFDRAWAIAERKFGDGGWQLPVNYSLYQMIAAVAEQQYPGLAKNISAINTVQTPISSFAEGDDPWQKISDAISQAALGYELFFDRNGVLTGYPTPDPRAATPVWTLAEGTTDTATAIKRTLTRSGIANEFIVSSAGTSDAVVVNGPFRGTAEDDYPASPTWVNSQFGRIYNFATSPYVTSEATANAAASNSLTLALGQTDVLTINTVPLPFLDIDDVLTINRSRLGLSNAKYVVDAITLPLGANDDADMEITARSVTTR